MIETQITVSWSEALAAVEEMAAQSISRPDCFSLADAQQLEASARVIRFSLFRAERP